MAAPVGRRIADSPRRATTEHTDRQVGRLIAIGGVVLILGQTTIQWSEFEEFTAWWNVLGVTQIAIVLLLAVFGGSLPFSVIRAGWLAVPLLGAVLQLTAFLGYQGSAPESVTPWQWRVEAVSTSFLVLWLRPWHAVAAVFISGSLTAVAAFATFGYLPVAIASMTLVRFSNLGFTAIFLGIRDRLNRLHDSEHLAQEQREHEVRAEIESERQARLARTIHDEILSALTAASAFPGAAPRELRQEASHALDVMRRSDRHGTSPADARSDSGHRQPAALASAALAPAKRVPAERALAELEPAELAPVELEPAELPTSVWAEGLAARIAELDPHCRVELEGPPADAARAELPRAAADALFGATLESLRNSLRHAGQHALRSIRITARPDSVAVRVLDDGRGFDMHALAGGGFGIGESILSRMRGAGGSASIRSAPGIGTEVTLHWPLTDGTEPTEHTEPEHTEPLNRAEFPARTSADSASADSGTTDSASADSDTAQAYGNANLGAGVGTRGARWALVVVWVLFVLSGLLDGAFSLSHPMQTVGACVALVGAVLLTTPGVGALAPSRALLVTACAASAAVLLLASGEVGGELWLVNFAAYLPALLIARGNPRIGLLGGLVLVVTGAAVCIGIGTPLGTIVEVFTIPLAALIVGVLWFLMLRSIVAREQAHRSEAARAAFSTRLAQEANAANIRELREICRDAEPLLEAVATGQPLSEELRREIAIVEAGIRDRIRSPGLQHPLLVEAITACRRRGVTVVVLGDGFEDAGDHLAAEVAAHLDGFDEGEVTIRALPAGRMGALSLRVSNEVRTERITFAADGAVEQRQR